MPTRVPDDNAGFDTYINTSTDHLLLGTTPVNWDRLLLTNAEMDDWSDYRDAWNVLYGQWGNPNTRTKTVTDDKNDLKKNFRTFTKPLLNRMSGASGITNADREALHIPVPDPNPTESPAIEVAPVVSLTAKQGGFMQIVCTVEEDSSRASMHPDADAIEVKIKIGPADGTAPATPDDCVLQLLSTKAKFNYEAGTVNAAKRIWIFCRYRNLKNSANNGPWSEVHTAIIQ